MKCFSRPLSTACLLTALLSGCDQPTEPKVAPGAPLFAVAPTQSAGDVSFTADDFASSLRAVANENELLIWMKEAGQARPDPNLFLDRQLGPSSIGMADPVEGQPQRDNLRLPTTLAASSKIKVVDLLEKPGIEPYWVGEALPVLAVRIPDAILEEVLALLLAHPNVDWMEANRRRRGRTLAGPLGNNPTDTTHWTHFVEGAWDHTRGDGAKIGVMDSGLAGTFGTTTYHPDAQYFSESGMITSGVVPMGFVADGGGCDSVEQSNGECYAFDDHGHGTRMVGLVGANDNDLPDNDGVGTAPQALVFSMKIAFNALRPGLTCGTFSWGDDDFCIEDEDWVAGLDFASSGGFDVLSMSFHSSSLSVSVATAISYVQHVRRPSISEPRQ